MLNRRSIVHRYIAPALGALALAGALHAGPASADGLLPGPLPTANVREGTGQLAYRVQVPCQSNRHVRNGWIYWRVCDFTLSASSGTAIFGLPGNGGDAYSYMRQVSGTARGNETHTLDLRIVDDSRFEGTETLFTDLRITVRECHAWAGNGGRYPNCNFQTGIRQWYQGQIRILDNDIRIQPRRIPIDLLRAG